MVKRIEELALDAGLLNYVDNETPRRCFIHGHADLEEVQKFAELIVREFADWVEGSVVRDKGSIPQDPHSQGWNDAVAYVAKSLRKRYSLEGIG